jgi:hypothetical protein
VSSSSLDQCSTGADQRRSHVFDFALPVSLDILSLAWHDRLQTTASVDPAVRDRDLKLLAWLEYAENLVEILKTQQAMRVTPSSAEAPSPRPREGPARLSA